ncbi:MAG: PEP-CTERM sorting domain-containing protein [Bryobacteraceae bacterium]|nr:PEP-CTERM sorting domain-containing protein [Bryobacteraceae bacterium]
MIPRSATGAELLVNGDFEAGLAGWTVTDLLGGSGSWFSSAAAPTPLSGFATVGPSAGLLYAVTDQTGPGTHSLTQSFLVPAGSTAVVLSFDMFVNDQSGEGPIIDPAGLDHAAGFPNQHARVDLLTGVAGAFDTGGGVVANFYLGVDAGANPHLYTAYVFDISALVVPGGTYQIRFAEVDTQFFFHQGVDNVSVVASGIPEPSTGVLFLSGLAGAVAVARLRSRGLSRARNCDSFPPWHFSLGVNS